MRLLALLVALLASGPAWAQVSVTGTVTDSSGTGLPGATVVLLNPADSVLVSFASSRSDGAFDVRRVREADYILKVSFVGYATHTQDIRVARDDLDVGTITLQQADGDLGRLVVDAERVPIVLRGDTLDYDAAAFATQQGAVVEDLLRRLPGVEVEDDGTVKAQGETVENVLVDGKEFFGDDPTVATRNLPADAVERVQVYDKASDTAEFTGVDDGEEKRTINLQLKADRRSGYFGNVGSGFGGVPTPEASGASRLLYDGQASVNRFSPTTQLSLIANVNNINRQSFSVGDYFQFMGGMGAMGRGGTFTIGGNGIPVGGETEAGFSDTFSIGLNGNHEFNARTSLRSSYFLHAIDKATTRFTRREQFFGDDLSSLLEEDSDGDDQTLVHRFTLGGSHEFAEDHDLRLRSSLLYGANDIVSIQQQETLGSSRLLQNASESDFRSDGSNLGGDASLTYRRKFAGNRSLVAELGGNMGDQDADADFLATTRLYDEGNLLTTEEIAQLQSQRTASLTGEGSILFTQPIGGRQAFQLRLSHRETAEDQTREVFDDIDGTPVLNDAQSSAFERIYRYDNAGLTYRKNGDTVELSAGIEGQLTRLGGTQQGASGEIDTRFLRALPSARLTLALAQSRNLEFRYETRTREPSVRELQPVVDNRDPLRIYTGNPDLRPAYTHSLNARYLSFDQFTSTNLFATLRASYSPTAISTSRTVDDQLRQITTPVNTSGTWSVSNSLSYGTAVRPIKARVRLSANTLYNRAIELVNAEDNTSNLFRTSARLSLENRNKEVVDASLGVRLTYNNVAYSLNPQLDRDYITRGLTASFGWTPTDEWGFRTVFDLDVYGDAVVGGGTVTRSVPLWRAEASRSFLDGRARVELVATDLLDRNLGVTFNNTASYVEEQRVNSLGRYVLMRLVYNLGPAGSGGSGIRIGG